jgi:hypothetical protein
MHSAQSVTVPPPRSAVRESHVCVTALLAAWLWLDVLWDAARHIPESSLAPPLAALAGLASQIVFTAVEAALASAAWGGLGTPVRWRVLAPRLLAISGAEALAVAIAAGGTSVPSAAAIWLAGARATPGAAASATGPVFAAFGVLTVVRLLLSARIQSWAAGAKLATGIGVVAVFYLATRLVMWWTFALLQGRSFGP